MSTPESSGVQALLAVLQEVRTWLALPDNDFTWSRWADATEALAAFDAHIRNIEEGHPFNAKDLATLFAPTGSIQEVSISSGWGKEFLELARRFDETHPALALG